MSNHILTIKTLKNGLRIAVISDHHATTVTASVLVGVGSAFETPRENGLAHFLEHMAFKGTVRRPSPKILLEEIESLGAVTNAFTSHEYTGYLIKGSPSHIAIFADILSDIYQNSTFPESEIQKEKGVIIEEINMYEDMIPYKVQDILFEMLYKDHAMARSILGTKETVSSFTQKDFVAYKDRHYHTSNTLIILAGNIKKADALKIAEKSFGTLPSYRKKSKRASAPKSQISSAVRLFKKSADQAHLTLAFRSIPMGHPDSAAIRVLATLLGRGLSSRLSLSLRDELGAAYYVSAGQESFTDQGFFMITAGIDKTRLAVVFERIVIELVNLKKELVGDAELSKAKEYFIGTLRLGLELSDDVASFYGGQMILGQKIKTPEQVIAEIKKVTAKDLKKVAQKLFKERAANLAVVGPFTDSQMPKKALKWL